jgi:uncharacterized protein YyaL (SSP411 family)
VPFLALLGRAYAPTLSVAAFEAGAAPAVLAEIAEGKTSAGAELAAYLCRNFTCTLPMRTVDALEAELRRARLVAPDAEVETVDEED